MTLFIALLLTQNADGIGQTNAPTDEIAALLKRCDEQRADKIFAINLQLEFAEKDLRNPKNRAKRSELRKLVGKLKSERLRVERGGYFASLIETPLKIGAIGMPPRRHSTRVAGDDTSVVNLIWNKSSTHKKNGLPIFSNRSVSEIVLLKGVPTKMGDETALPAAIKVVDIVKIDSDLNSGLGGHILVAEPYDLKPVEEYAQKMINKKLRKGN